MKPASPNDLGHPGRTQLSGGSRALLLASTTLMLAVVASLVWLTEAHRPDRIVIAAIYPNSGTDSIQGRSLERGFAVADSVFGKELRRSSRYEIVFRPYDDASSASASAGAAARAAGNPRTLIAIGHFKSETALSGLQVYSPAGLPVVLPTATQTLLREQPGAFLMSPPNKVQADALVRFVSETLGDDRVFIVSESSDYGSSLREEMLTALQGFGIKEIGESVFTGASDGNGTLARLSTLRPTAVIYLGYAATGALLLRQMRSSGIESAFVGADALRGHVFRDNLGGIDAGEVYVAYQAPDTTALRARPEWQVYEERLGQIFEDEEPWGWAAWGYDAAAIAFDVIARATEAGDNPSRTLVREVLEGKRPRMEEEGGRYTFGGALGDYEFEERPRHNLAGTFHMYRFENGQYSFFPGHVNGR